MKTAVAQSVKKVDAFIGRTFDIYRRQDGQLMMRTKVGHHNEYPITEASGVAWVEHQLNPGAGPAPLEIV